MSEFVEYLRIGHQSQGEWNDETLAELFLLMEKPEWHERAACKGLTDLMYSERGESTREAKAVCASCPVRRQCRESALERNEQWGVWGGMSGKERRRARRGRAA